MFSIGMYLAKFKDAIVSAGCFQPRVPQQDNNMKTVRLVLLLLLSAGPAYPTPIPTSRLPGPGYWNPGCIGANGQTYRQSGTFVAPVTLTNIINVKNPPFNAVGNGIHDDTTNLQAAIAAGNNSVIYLPAGTYKITAQLQLANPNWPWGWTPKILRGAGPTNTFIKAYNTSGGAFIDASGSGPGTERAVRLAQFAPRGTNTIVLASWDGNGFFDSQNWGIIYQSNRVAGPPWSSGQGYTEFSRSQILHITARNSAAHTITFDTPLYLDWSTNTLFTIFYSTDAAIGVESLSIENVSGYGTHNIAFSGVFNSWIRNIESKNAYGWHIRLNDCARCDILDSYIHGFYPVGGVGGGNSVYGAGIFGQSTDNLIMDNRFDQCRHAMIVEDGDTGNVFAYNCSTMPINEGQTNTTYLMGDMIQHGNTQFNLWEGNVAADFRMDDVIGGSVYNMSFRNNMTRSSYPTVSVGKWGYDIQVSNYWISVVGSVLNNVGYNPTWRVGAPDANGDYPYPGPQGNGMDAFVNPAGTPADPAPTLYVHGVVDLQSNVVTWVSTNLDHTLPPSLFLNTAPAFWTVGLPWPAIGPDVIGYTNIIPAQTLTLTWASPSTTVTNNPPGTNSVAPPTQLKVLN